MRKAFLKPVAVFMIACMFVLMCGGFTTKEKDEVFTEIVIVGVDCCEKEQQITATLNGEILISPANILCIFGHSLSEGRAITTDHRFWVASPRCRQTVHRVVYCTRSGCNHMVLTQLSQSRIPCCA
jgi:hypothetical protein